MNLRFSENNICINTDSYKVSQYPQYPVSSEEIYSYGNARYSKFNGIVFFGLQYNIIKNLVGQVITKEFIDEAELFWKLHFGKDIFNRKGFEYILDYHNGYLPIEIKAVPEGTYIPTNNVLFTIRNTDPKCYWLTNWLETILSHVWYTSVIATNSNHCKNILLDFLNKNGDPNTINFKLHDFGFRGVTCNEQAMIGGMSHLTSFCGTDTSLGVIGAINYYNAEMCGFSIPASEHSTITSWGEENEILAMKNILEKYPDGLVACVSDSYDIFRACEEYWGTILKDQIMHRDGCLVIRPDSGNPLIVLPKVLDILWEKFGGTINDKGYKVLDSHVRLIQGDGIDSNTLYDILAKLHELKYSADNIAFGSGGGLLQKFNRDDIGFAIKCSSIVEDGEQYDVYKNPITDFNKTSHKGRLKLIIDNGVYKTVNVNDEKYLNYEDLLELVFFNGKLIKEQNFDEIRARIEKSRNAI